MPSIDIDPIVQPTADKLNVRYIVIDRFGPDSTTPTIRMVYNSGYYPVDADGNRIPNALGFDRFVAQGFTEEESVPLTDPVVQGILAAAEEPTRAFISANPGVPLFAILDDYLAEMALAYRTAKKTGEPQPIAPGQNG